MAHNDGTLLMEGAEVVFRNFTGKEGMYNAEGQRNFCVLLDPEIVPQLQEDGWNVKFLKPREEGDDPRPYLQVEVKYRDRQGKPVRPPTVVLITSKGRTKLNEDEVELLDWIDIQKTDLIIRPYQWAVNGKSGTKAYLKSIYMTMQEDALEQKYADVPELEGGGAKALPSGGDDDVVDVEFWEEPEAKALNAGSAPWDEG